MKASEGVLGTVGITKGQLFEWFAGDKTGMFTLRLTVKDAVEHQGQDSVTIEVLPQIKSQKGGERSSNDGLATLYLPPRALPKDTIVTINPVPKFVFREGIHPLKTETDEIKPPPDNVRSLNAAYEIKPEDLSLRSIKPATLQIKLDGIPAQNKKHLAFFRWDEKWFFLGGTVRKDKIIVGITKFGIYALMEVEATFERPGIDSLFTCQPRAFSPKEGKTTISFSLPKESSVTLKVYNLDGRLQRTLVSGETMYAGRNAVIWDGRDENYRIVPSGLYLIALSVDNGGIKTKAVVIKNR